MEESQTEKNFKMLISTKIEAVSSLEKLEKISKNISIREREFIEQRIDSHKKVKFSHIQATIDSGRIAMGGLKGASAGLGSAAGAWALAGLVGTASTGTAISTLSGAALTSTALAWLGGGPIAVGGLGVAGGTALLGGIIALPILGFIGVRSHISANNEIEKITKKEGKVILAINGCKQILLTLSGLTRRSIEIIHSIKRMENVFEEKFNEIHKELYSFRARVFRSIRSWFGMAYFTQRELKKIAYIGEIATNLANLIDTPVLDDNGKPI